MKDPDDDAQAATGPRFATGKQMHDRIAVDRPPHEITLRGLSPKIQPRLSIATTKRLTSK